MVKQMNLITRFNRKIASLLFPIALKKWLGVKTLALLAGTLVTSSLVTSTAVITEASAQQTQITGGFIASSPAAITRPVTNTSSSAFGRKMGLIAGKAIINASVDEDGVPIFTTVEMPPVFDFSTQEVNPDGTFAHRRAINKYIVFATPNEDGTGPCDIRTSRVDEDTVFQYTLLDGSGTVFTDDEDYDFSLVDSSSFKHAARPKFEAYCVEPPRHPVLNPGPAGVHEPMEMHYIAFGTATGEQEIPMVGGGVKRLQLLREIPSDAVQGGVNCLPGIGVGIRCGITRRLDFRYAGFFYPNGSVIPAGSLDTTFHDQNLPPLFLDNQPVVLTQLADHGIDYNRSPAELVDGEIEERAFLPFRVPMIDQSRSSRNGYDIFAHRFNIPELAPQRPFDPGAGVGRVFNRNGFTLIVPTSSRASGGDATHTEMINAVVIAQSRPTIASDTSRSAVECERLDLTTLGGPASFAIQAYQNFPTNAGPASGRAGIADGWDQGCTADEAIPFAPGCFTDPDDVIVVASLNGTPIMDDGAIVRRCEPAGIDLTQGVAFTIDDDIYADNQRGPDPGAPYHQIGMLALESSIALPVTMNYFRSQKIAKTRKTKSGTQLNKNDIVLRWQSLTEVENIGYHLWAKVKGDWKVINKNLINAKSPNTFMASDTYTYTISAKAASNLGIKNGTPIGLTSVSTTAEEEFFGPYKIGKRYGSLMDSKPIDWKEIRQAYNETMDAKGYIFKNNRYVAKRKISNNQATSAILTFDKPGMARVTHSDLLEAGVDLRKVSAKDIAISYKGQPVSRYINITPRGLFTNRSSIDFYVDELEGTDPIYEKNNAYRVSINRNLAKEAKVQFQVNRKRTGADSKVTVVKAMLNDNNSYLATSKNESDPFIMGQVFALNGKTGTAIYEMDVPELNAGNANLKIDLSNYSSGHDSKWLISVNGSEVFNGTTESESTQVMNIETPSEIFALGSNEITIELINENDAPILYSTIESISIEQEETINIDKNDSLNLTSETDTARYFEVSVDRAKDYRFYYIVNDNGNMAKMGLRHRTNTPSDKVYMTNVGLDSHYFLGKIKDLIRPVTVDNIATIKDDALYSQADYLVIAHPMFDNNADMDRFVQQKESTGHRVHVVNTDEVFQKFSDGMRLPSSIKEYIRFFNSQSPLKNVLIVGGDMYDYHNYVSEGMSFVPSFYTNDGKGNTFVPSDVMYVDLDGNDIEDFPIGRWPLREASQLKVMVDKTIDYENDVRNGVLTESLFIADERNEEQVDYNTTMRNMRQYQDNKLNKTIISADEITNGGGTITDVRQAIFDKASGKVISTIYNGHSSPARWSFANLLDTNNVGGLDENGSLGMVMPLACYTSYTLSPTGDSLGYKLMANEGGAVTLHGPALLTSHNANKIFGQKIQYKLRDGMTLGEAIMTSKKHNTARAIKHNWLLMGDPSLKMSN